ncbi:hypothetical protein CTT30_20320 [Vibrio coralliilyticus]|nr:hypothetical protein CTT30_20320 [Vibrio coralliilyticus]
MKKLLAILATTLFTIPSVASEGEVHWTATVYRVTAMENESVWIGLKDHTNPNPASSEWKCGHDIVWLSSNNKPSPKAMLSTALTAYSTQKPVRIGVTQNSGLCEARYLSARE